MEQLGSCSLKRTPKRHAAEILSPQATVRQAVIVRLARLVALADIAAEAAALAACVGNATHGHSNWLPLLSSSPTTASRLIHAPPDHAIISMNPQSITSVFVGCISLLTTACSVSPTSKFFQEANGPAIRDLGLRHVSPSEVLVKTIDPSVLRDKARFQQWQRSNQIDRNLVFLGASDYNREGQPSQEEIRLAASRLGAKVAYVHMPYAGKGRKTISVPIAHTTGRTITQSSDSYGSLSGNGYTSGMYGNTPYSSNTYMSGSYSGSTTSSTYIPGTTTYAARDVSYDSFDIKVMFYTPRENVSEKGLQRLKASREENSRY